MHEDTLLSEGTFVLALDEVPVERHLLRAASGNLESVEASSSLRKAQAVDFDLVVEHDENDACEGAVDITDLVDTGKYALGSTLGATIDTDRPICR